MPVLCQGAVSCGVTLPLRGSPLGEKGRGSIPPGDSLLRNAPGRQRVFAALLLNIGVLTWPVELLTSTGLIGP